MEQSSNKRRTRQRKHRRRRMIRFAGRCLCIGMMATVLVFAVQMYEGINIADTVQVSEEEYPDSLIALQERNPETKEFVMNYPENKDIDFEIDLSDEVTKGTIPLFLQWDERWGYETYGSDFMAVTGCGPTCLSMVWCGLSGSTDWNPLAVAYMAEEQGFYVDDIGSSWDLMTDGASKIGLTVDTVVYDAEHIMSKLEQGIPIICIMRPGDFTASGHFIVLTGVDNEGKVTVCDPNSKVNSEKSWDVEELIPQIKNLWCYTLS